MQVLCDTDIAQQCVAWLDRLPGDHRLRVLRLADYAAASLHTVVDRDTLLVLPYAALVDDWPPVFLGVHCVQPLPYLEPDNVDRWFAAFHRRAELPSRGVVTCMQKPFYDQWACRIADTLNRVGYFDQVLLKRPRDTDRDELSALLAEGFRIGFYCGHGRSRGFSGYRGVRWEHLAQSRATDPGGMFIALTCSTLAAEKQHSNPLGIDWINSGRLISYLGFATAVRIEPLARITHLMLRELAGAPDLKTWLRQVRVAIDASDHEALQTFADLRLLGSAEVPLAGG